MSKESTDYASLSAGELASLAEKRGIDAEKVKGSGASGNILMKDWIRELEKLDRKEAKEEAEPMNEPSDEEVEKLVAAGDADALGAAKITTSKAPAGVRWKRTTAKPAEAPDQLIERRDGVRGGRPIIAGTSVSVQAIAGWKLAGKSVKWIVDNYEHLSVEQVKAALAYYEQNTAEIDGYIAADVEAEQKALAETATETAGGVKVGDVVSYRDKFIGSAQDARVSGIVNAETGVVNLAVFSGAGGARRREAVPRGRTSGTWEPKEVA